MDAPIRTESARDGAVERIWLARPKANVLDAEMIVALREHLRSLREKPGVKLVIVEGDGPHFSFGASVAEHLPDRVAGMLHEFHALIADLEAVGAPTAAVVRGQCLGGGLELALACGLVYCDPTARLGLPEIQLGVFPPAGSLLLPLRVGPTTAARMVLGGQPVGGAEAARIGLADVCTDDPEGALWAWYEADLAPKSAVAVRYAWRALRTPALRALEALPAVERLYLDGLMAHRDPVEGLEAFLAKRPPVWSHA